MGLLASLKVMLGIDTVDYQAKMRSASDSASLFENNFGKRSDLVQRHGLKLVRTAENVSGAMQRMSVDAGGAITQLAESAGFGNLAIAIAGAAVTTTVLGAAVKAIAASSRDAGKPLGEMADAIVGDQAAIEGLVAQIDLLAKRAGSSAEQLGVSAEATKENVVGLLALRDSLEKEAIARRNSSEQYKLFLVQQKLGVEAGAEEKRLHEESVAALDAAREAQARFNAEHGKFVPAATQVQIALAAGIAKEKEFAEQTRKTLGVMNAEDLRAKAAALEAQVVAIAKSGGSASQTVDALGGQIDTVVKVAKELGVQLTPQFDDIAEAVAKGPGLAMDDLFARFKGLPDEVAKSRTASAGDLDKMGDDLRGSVSGGFGKGVEEGISYGEQALDDWRGRIQAEGIVVPIRPDWTEVNKGIAAMKRGDMPDLSGYGGPAS